MVCRVLSRVHLSVSDRRGTVHCEGCSLGRLLLFLSQPLCEFGYPGEKRQENPVHHCGGELTGSLQITNLVSVSGPHFGHFKSMNHRLQGVPKSQMGTGVLAASFGSRKSDGTHGPPGSTTSNSST